MPTNEAEASSASKSRHILAPERFVAWLKHKSELPLLKTFGEEKQRTKVNQAWWMLLPQN